MKKQSRSYDQFPNFFTVNISTANAGVPVYTPWNTGYSIKDGFAFIIHKIIYKLTSSVIPDISGVSGNYVAMALATRTDLTADMLRNDGVNEAILDNWFLSLRWNSAIGLAFLEQEWVHDFTNEPGGGRIIAPKPVYAWMCADDGGAGVLVAKGLMQVVYTILKINNEQYRELYEAMNPNA